MGQQYAIHAAQMIFYTTSLTPAETFPLQNRKTFPPVKH